MSFEFRSPCAGLKLKLEMRKQPRIKKTESERKRFKPFSQRSMIRRPLLLCSSAEFQFSKTKSNIIRLIALFFFCLQFSAFWDFRWQKTMSFNDSKNKKNWSGLTRVWPGGPGPGSTGFPRVNSWAGFCLNPDRSQARVGQVPGRPAGPVRVLKHCSQSTQIQGFHPGPPHSFVLGSHAWPQNASY